MTAADPDTMPDGFTRADGARGVPPLRLEFAGEFHVIEPQSMFTIGREGDLSIDENLYLHRHFLQISHSGGLWWLSNIGSRLTATVTDSSGGVQAWLAPGARLPLVFAVTTVVFSAGPTTYELMIHAMQPTFRPVRREQLDGDATIGDVALTHSQRLLIIALAEPQLRRDGSGMSEIPSSAKAAERLGWAITRFNRKLDNVCDKLDRIGVPGMRGGPGTVATNRRARLVEHAIATRLVTREDLELLDQPSDGDDDLDGAEDAGA